MDFDSLLVAAKEIGFPIFVAAFLMVRIESKIERLARTIEKCQDVHK